MRPAIALLPVAALMLALGGCDKQSGNSTQGAGNTVTSDEVTSDEVASDARATQGDGDDSSVSR